MIYRKVVCKACRSHARHAHGVGLSVVEVSSAHDRVVVVPSRRQLS